MIARRQFPSYGASPRLAARRSDELQWAPTGRAATADHGAWPVGGGSPVVAGWAVLLSWSKGWIEHIRSERRIRRGMDELIALDDRMLADIGLSRVDLAYAVRYGTLPSRDAPGAQW
jgi:hypothetical protein